jgi:transposase
MRFRDDFGLIFEDQAFTTLFPTRGQPGLAPWRLALIILFQFLENITDRQAAQMVRSRIDWKYTLGLELTDTGFDYSVLSEFRNRLLQGNVEPLFLEAILNKARELGLMKTRGRQRTDSTHVLAAVRELNRLEFMGETLRSALNSLAEEAPEWLVAQLGPATLKQWIERYGSRVEDYRLPQQAKERQEYALLIGGDGFQLLKAVYGSVVPLELRELEAVQVLRQVWLCHYYREEARLEWRDPKELARTGNLISSPYDFEARYGTKRNKNWVGYKVHQTETCDDGTPRLITHVATTPGTVLDVQMLQPIQQALAEKELLPAQHLVDAGYPDAEMLVKSQEKYQIEVVGPVAQDQSWQKREGGHSAEEFKIEWEAQKVLCPNGQESKSWIVTKDSCGNAMIYVRFARKSCQLCKERALCTRSKTGSRSLSLRSKEQYEVLQIARKHQQSEKFKEQYKHRAGIEGSLSQGVRAFGMRESRYIGLGKVHLQQVVTATAMNVVRIMNWLDDKPLAKTRVSRFAALPLVG